jgi:hypothetical protein
LPIRVVAVWNIMMTPHHALMGQGMPHPSVRPASWDSFPLVKQVLAQGVNAHLGGSARREARWV